MKKNFRVGHILSRLAALALVCAFACCMLASCSADKKDTALELGEHKISVSFYEFMLSRMKGELARDKYDVSAGSDFWNANVSGKSREQYYNELVLDRCKNYLAALALYEEEGLSLSSATLESIEEEIAFYVDYDGQGSEQKLNAILKKYGADVDVLREIYVIEAKYQQLMTLLYGSGGSQISDGVKEQYYKENYYRFKQIFVSDYYYKYQLDEAGSVIYFDPETSKPIYDSENGHKIYDSEGMAQKDSFGTTIYYDGEGKPLYDMERGYPTPILDGNGEAVKYDYTPEQMEIRVGRMQLLLNKLEDGDFAAFEAEIPDWKLYDGADEYYTEGYYLSRIECAGYEPYMLDILEALEGAEAGEINVVESEHGYHVIMKYELDGGKYADAEYAEWFASFNESLKNKLFLDKCRKLYGDIAVNEEILKGARSIKEIGTNFDY
ncbi:MAG: hypothetical protein IJC64_02425 [Clostridia bacterium]|nr:hypothetical protein [Clostridia bacterium]